MSAPPGCARCGGPVRQPGLWSSRWRCDVHGIVEPLHHPVVPSHRALTHMVERSRVPVWVPDPLPPGWLISGFTYAGDERERAPATVVALSGPSPLGGPADLLLVAEEPGVGLGARYAGLAGPDPGELLRGPVAAKLEAAGHPTPLWDCPGVGEDRAALVGEAKGLWLWVVLHPAPASLLLLEDLLLRDARDGIIEPPVFGALTPRITAPVATAPPTQA
ncbi:MAG: DUF6758 family protein [Mycobacteriales bacterium]